MRNLSRTGFFHVRAATSGDSEEDVVAEEVWWLIFYTNVVFFNKASLEIWRLHFHHPFSMLSSKRGSAKAMIEFNQDLLEISGFGYNVDSCRVYFFI